ncbi:hypothetical protein IAD21_00726 [Abditibacteriota bacterium]|nr:hypothetical protein IAD21_00726 [Abditibacteriota bacterium]
MHGCIFLRFIQLRGLAAIEKLYHKFFNARRTELELSSPLLHPVPSYSGQTLIARQ